MLVGVWTPRVHDNNNNGITQQIRWKSNSSFGEVIIYRDEPDRAQGLFIQCQIELFWFSYAASGVRSVCSKTVELHKIMLIVLLASTVTNIGSYKYLWGLFAVRLGCINIIMKLVNSVAFLLPIAGEFKMEEPV